MATSARTLCWVTLHALVAPCALAEAKVHPDAPYDASPLIESVAFGATKSAAPGSDNWPVTWADDDHIYTTYGDGTGFDGKGQLSLGYARLSGGGDSFVGTDIAEPTGEDTGGRAAERRPRES
jgi:hypothetical protein